MMMELSSDKTNGAPLHHHPFVYPDRPEGPCYAAGVLPPLRPELMSPLSPEFSIVTTPMEASHFQKSFVLRSEVLFYLFLFCFIISSS